MKNYQIRSKMHKKIEKFKLTKTHRPQFKK